MYYVLCEDSGSGFQFFDMVCGLFLGKSQYFIDSSHGNRNIRNKLFELSSLFNEGDKLLLAVDNVEQDEYFDLYDILAVCDGFVEKIGISYCYTLYYCFEELYFIL